MFTTSSLIVISFHTTETFYAYSNRMSGTLPSELGSTGLTELQLFSNRFTGTLADEFYNNIGLTLLRLDFNSFSGAISSRIGDMIDLKELWMNNNTFTGSLPATVARLSNMRESVIVFSSSGRDFEARLPYVSFPRFFHSSTHRDSSIE